MTSSLGDRESSFHMTHAPLRVAVLCIAVAGCEFATETSGDPALDEPARWVEVKPGDRVPRRTTPDAGMPAWSGGPMKQAMAGRAAAQPSAGHSEEASRGAAGDGEAGPAAADGGGAGSESAGIGSVRSDTAGTGGAEAGSGSAGTGSVVTGVAGAPSAGTGGSDAGASTAGVGGTSGAGTSGSGGAGVAGSGDDDDDRGALAELIELIDGLRGRELRRLFGELTRATSLDVPLVTRVLRTLADSDLCRRGGSACEDACRLVQSRCQSCADDASCDAAWERACGDPARCD